MRDRATAIAVALATAAALAACGGGAEKNVVNQYFTALRANDTNTLTSFAMVQFDKPVEAWKIVAVTNETKAPAPLAELAKKQKELEAEQKKNEREYRAWGNDLAVYPKLDQIKAARAKGGQAPAGLQAIAEKYDAFQAKDRSLKKAVADAKAAVEREKHIVSLSVGQVEDADVESLTGEMVTKDVELQLTSGGQAAPYVMTLRKYNLTSTSGPRSVARWVVQSLTPKS